ncbi:hypothetical protein [Vibrio jasicida]|uniref:hypothetical protein n=1 Tax=Vibrio jasicida TaxID=766224 RepID=UPI0005EE7028|nr:hypothetical protein [Vibrio jasicida]
MIMIRIASSLILFLLGLWISDINMTGLYGAGDYIVLSSVINIWAGVACLLWGGYGIIYYLNNILPISLPVGNFNKVTIFQGLILAPIVTLCIHYQLSTIVSDYVECKDQREISSRYSSRTYAISPELCDSLKQ